MITTDNQSELRSWLARHQNARVNLDMQCIGDLHEGLLTFVVGYENYNGASIWIHMASDGRGVASRELLWAAFDYPFNKCDVSVVLATVPASNERSIRLTKHLGFKQIHEIKGAHPDGPLLIFAMYREECRFLNLTRNRHGKQRQSTTAA